MTATLRSPFNLSAHLRPTVGDQKISFTGVDHMGWLKCDGRSLSRDTYGLLFGVIGTTFGSEDSSTFKLPDYSGAVPGIAGQYPFSNGSNDVNPAPYVIGDRTGEQRHRLIIDEMPTHTHGSSNAVGNSNGDSNTTSNGLHAHTINDPGHTHSYNNQIQAIPIHNITTQTDAADNTNTPQTTGSNVTGISINSNGLHNHQIFNTGGSNFHNNMQPTLFGGNMFIYSGKNMQAYFPYTWVGGVPAANGTATPGNVLVF